LTDGAREPKLSVVRAAVLSVLLLASAGCFGPRFEEGALDCSATQLCPPGLTCIDGRCRSGPGPGTDGGPSDDAGDLPDGAPPAALSCVAALDGGGTSAQLTTFGVTPDDVDVLDTLDLENDDEEAPVASFQDRLTLCGGRLFAVAAEDGVIVEVGLASGGALELITAHSSLGQVVAAACSGDSTLWTGSNLAGELVVRSYNVEGGGMRLVGAFDAGSAGEPLRSLHLVPTPGVNQLWVVIVRDDTLDPNADDEITLIDSNGQVLDGPEDPGLDDIGTFSGFSPEGDLFVVSGHDGDCTASWPVAADYSIPSQSDRRERCDGFTADEHTFAGPARLVQSATTESNELRLLDVDGGDLSVFDRVDDDRLDGAKLTAVDNGRVVVAASGIGDRIAAFVVDNEDLRLIDGDGHSFDNLRDLVAIPCE
jgi:hypothetical protein